MFTNALLSTMQILVAAFGFMLCVCVIKNSCVYFGVCLSVCGLLLSVCVCVLLVVQDSVTLPDIFSSFFLLIHSSNLIETIS